MSIRDEAARTYAEQACYQDENIPIAEAGFRAGWEAARAHLAAQETYGERAPCGCDLTGPVPPAVHIVDRHEEER